MILSDMHVHTLFSCDSKATMEEYCEHAFSQPEINYICFTDHVDNNRRDVGCGYYNCEAFLKSFNSVKEKYGKKINLLSGIEFGEPHLYKKELERLTQLPYDFIMGTIHFWYNNLFASEMLTSQLPLEESYKLYWEEVAKAVKAGGFDVLAHMDFPKRYYKELLYDSNTILDIFKEMLQNDIIIEINTSSQRKGLDEPMPGLEILKLYKEAGGKYVTTASDAHSPSELCACYPNEILEHFGLTPVVYINRQRIIL